MTNTHVALLALVMAVDNGMDHGALSEFGAGNERFGSIRDSMRAHKAGSVPLIADLLGREMSLGEWAERCMFSDRAFLLSDRPALAIGEPGRFVPGCDALFLGVDFIPGWQKDASPPLESFAIWEYLPRS